MKKEYFNIFFLNIGWGLYHLIYKTRSRRFQQELRKLAEVIFLTLRKACPGEKYSIDYSLGILYCHSIPPRFRESKKRLESALRLSRTNHQGAKALNALGTLYYEQKKYPQALTLYRKALKKAKHKSVPLYNIAFTYEKMGKKKEAIESAKNSIKEMRGETDLQHTTNPPKTLKQLIQRCRK